MLFETAPLFEKNYQYTKTSGLKIIVNQGGTSSGKTYTLQQLLFLIAIEDPGCIITVAGQDIPNLKKGAIRDAQAIVANSSLLQSYVSSYNKSDRIYYFNNGSILEFTSYSDEQDAKSGKRDYLFLNEANGIQYMVAWQLIIRTRKKVFIDYNPTSKFWVHDNILTRNDAKQIISDHRHNPFLPQELHEEIEGIEDEELWKVYARGLTGQIKGLIYPKYNLIDAIPATVKTCLGLDFGFNHKMALVETGRWENRIFSNELVYRTEMTTGELIGEMKELGISRQTPIYADSARPDAIKEIRNAGFNCLPADKSVVDGINFIKQHQHWVTRGSKGLIKEINQYKWKEKDGVTLDEPVKFMDDAMDAMRYGHYTGRKGNGLIVSNPQNYDILDLLNL